MIDLSNITICTIAGVGEEMAAKVLSYCCREIKFGDVILFSEHKPGNKFPGRWVKSKLPTFDSCSDFHIYETPKHLRTDYMMQVQNDGFIIHPKNWREEFLTYDFIAAPWKPDYPSPNRVGCGGFIIQSRSLMENWMKIVETYPSLETRKNWGSDYWISAIIYQQMIDLGLKYAPVEIAAKFALEYEIPEAPYSDEGCFGFHKFTTPQREKYKEEVLEWSANA